MSDSDDDKALVIPAFINLQNKELQVREQELRVEAEDLVNKKEIALASIKAQAEDREGTRGIYEKIEQRKHTTARISILIFAVLFIACLVIGDRDLALKLVEWSALLFAGALGGYGYAVKKQQDEDS